MTILYGGYTFLTLNHVCRPCRYQASLDQCFSSLVIPFDSVEVSDHADFVDVLSHFFAHVLKKKEVTNFSFEMHGT